MQHNRTMKVVVLYRERSDHRRDVETFVGDLKKVSGRTVETLEVDSRGGADFARLYDIVQYPAIAVSRSDGHLQKLWQGLDNWPTINDIEFYLDRF